MIILAGCMLLFNNLVAFGMVKLFVYIWGGSGNTLTDELMNMKGCYTFAMISTFISSVYANAFYTRSIIEARNQKQVLDQAPPFEFHTAQGVCAHHGYRDSKDQSCPHCL